MQASQLAVTGTAASNSIVPRRDTHNPRWQSRPQTQRGNYSRQPREYTNSAPQDELYEGDYEQFSTPGASRDPAEQHRQHEDTTEQVEEQHVTRLPDGRVLK